MPVVAPAITTVPPGRSDFRECDQVASPTVSMTRSTRSGTVSYTHLTLPTILRV